MATILTGKGQEIQVSDADYADLSRFTWWINDSGYALRRAKLPDGSWGYERMHRRLTGLQPGDKTEVDHRNGARADNRRENLRLATHTENSLNRGKASHNRSGFKGVTKHPLCKDKWQARIRFNGKQRHLGLFDTAEDAHEFYCLAADMVHGEFARHA
jgi:hypothetical protein